MKCPFCGADIDDPNAIYCMFCGAKIPERFRREQPSPPSPRIVPIMPPNRSTYNPPDLSSNSEQKISHSSTNYHIYSQLDQEKKLEN